MSIRNTNQKVDSQKYSEGWDRIWSKGSPKVEPFPDFLDEEDIMEVSTMKKRIDCGMFLDCDGHGYYATKDGESSMEFKPSNFNPPEWATHVSWYNR